MLSSLRRRPLEPPSSLTVTTAQRSRITGEPGWATAISAGVSAKRLSPLSRVERPVPPPMATTRRPRCASSSPGTRDRRFWFPSGKLVFEALTNCVDLKRFVFPERAFRRSHVGSGIRVQQLGKARVFGQVVEVGVIARLVAQAGIQAQRLLQMLQRVFHVTGEAIERSQTVNHEISLRRLLQQLLDVLARGDVIPTFMRETA